MKLTMAFSISDLLYSIIVPNHPRFLNAFFCALGFEHWNRDIQDVLPFYILDIKLFGLYYIHIIIIIIIIMNIIITII